MQGVNLSDCSYPPTETGTWAGFTHWSVFPLGCLTFIKNGWKDHSGNFTINQNCQASPFLKVMHGRSTTNQKRYPDPGSDASSVWNFCALFSDVNPNPKPFPGGGGGKPVIAAPNVGCFVRVLDRKPLLNLRTKHFELPAATLQTAFPRTQNLIIFLGKLCMPLYPQGAQPKIPKISVWNQMEQTISIRSDRNIWDHPSRWSTLTGQVTSVGRTETSLSIWQNCCPQYRSFVSC